VRDLPPPPRATPIEFLDALGSLYRNAGAANTAVSIAWECFRRRAMQLCGRRGSQVGATELATVIRNRFPQADPSMEADFATCEEASWSETTAPREALRLIQILHGHREKLLATAKLGIIGQISHLPPQSPSSSANHPSQTKERAS
jgi:hypothetical protein